MSRLTRRRTTRRRAPYDHGPGRHAGGLHAVTAARNGPGLSLGLTRPGDQLLTVVVQKLEVRCGARLSRRLRPGPGSTGGHSARTGFGPRYQAAHMARKARLFSPETSVGGKKSYTVQGSSGTFSLSRRSPKHLPSYTSFSRLESVQARWGEKRELREGDGVLAPGA